METFLDHVEKDLQKMEEGSKRHLHLTSSDLNEIEENKEERNTKKVTNWALSVFDDWAKHCGLTVNWPTVQATELNNILRRFYAEVRTSSGTQYAISSYLGLRSGLSRHLNSPGVGRSDTINLITDSQFKTSNNVFTSVIKTYRRAQKDRSQHHPAVSVADLAKLRQSPALSPLTAPGLVRKVWLDIQLNMARRGREGLRDLKADSFVVREDENGCEYVSLKFNEHTKNHHNSTEKSQENNMLYVRCTW